MRTYLALKLIVYSVIVGVIELAGRVGYALLIHASIPDAISLAFSATISCIVGLIVGCVVGVNAYRDFAEKEKKPLAPIIRVIIHG